MSKETSSAASVSQDRPDPSTILDRLDYAFQPIVNVATGHCFGYEALLRRHDLHGFPDQRSFFDACHASGCLDAAQLQLWEIAIARFAGLADSRGSRLFLNIDSRSLDGTDFLPRHIRGLLAHYDVAETAVALEISEPPSGASDATAPWVRGLKRYNCKIAVDRFGGGVAGFQMLYGVEPEFLKLDQFFIRNVSGDSKKKMLLSNVVGTAHLLGIIVIAVGVENETEFLTCKEVGCDLVQGFMIDRPTFEPKNLPMHYERIEELSRHERRGKGQRPQKSSSIRWRRSSPWPSMRKSPRFSNACAAIRARHSCRWSTAWASPWDRPRKQYQELRLFAFWKRPYFKQRVRAKTQGFHRPLPDCRCADAGREHHVDLFGRRGGRRHHPGRSDALCRLSFGALDHPCHQ